MVSAVVISDVHKHYGSVRALNGVSFSIEPGEFFGLLGPNGAGKSTLINTMAGLTRATSGRIEVMGHDVVRDYRRSRAALGVVPQELVYDPFFTVREVLRLQSGYFGIGRANHQWIDELLAVLNLADKADNNLQQLSGGMKRRVLIAQALVHKPDVLVLDEPTAGVDVELRQSLWDFACRLHREEGKTIVLTTHYLEEAEALCERIAIINRGELAALDSKKALLSRHPYRLLRVTVDREDAGLSESLQERLVSREGCTMLFRLHRETEQVGPLLDALRGLRLDVVDLQITEPRLEEVFLELTGQKVAA